MRHGGGFRAAGAPGPLSRKALIAAVARPRVNYAGIAVAVVSVAVGGFILYVVLAGIGNALDCESFIGYDPSKEGADRFPAGTWAGYCNMLQALG